MYEQFYGLERAPFNVTPDPEFLYHGPSHREALAAITYGVDQRKGFIVVVGEVGLGKTTVLRSWVGSIDPKQTTVAYVFNANVSFTQLLDTICRELIIHRAPEDDHYAMVNRLHYFLIGEYRRGRNVVLIVDEAQNMPVETLEQLRLLSNLESEKEKLLQIVMVGQPEFARMLERDELRQLRQRIAVRATIAPLTDEQAQEYIEFRLNRAGTSTPAVFTDAAVKRIVSHAAGVPRVLNIVCDNALAAGLGYEQKPVTPAVVNEVIRDLAGEKPSESPSPTRKWGVAACAAFVVLLALGWFARGALFSWTGVGQAREMAVAGGAGGSGPAAGLPGNAPPARTEPRTAAGSGAGVGGAVNAAMPRSADERSSSTSGPEPQGPATAADAGLQTPGAAEAARQQAGQALGGQPFAVRAPDVARTVRTGDTLHSMAREVYGFATDAVVRRVVESNPSITNADTILVGSVIRFPDVSDLPREDPRPRRVR